MSFFKKAKDKLIGIYGYLLPLTFSVSFLFLVITALSLINDITTYIGLGILLFLFFPLLLSIQLFATKIFSYKTDIDYKDIYKQFKVYYTPMFRGVYSIIPAFLFAILSLFIYVGIFEGILINFDPNFLELALNTPEGTIDYIYSLPYVNQVLIIGFGLMVFVFLYRILSKAVNVYLACFCGIDKRHVKLFNRYLKANKLYDIKANLRHIGLPFCGLYLVIYIISSLVAYNFTNNFELSLFIALSISLLVSSLYLPIYLSGCYLISLDLKEISPYFLKIEITKEYEMFMNNPNLSDEEKKFIEEKYQNIKKVFPNEDKSNEDKEKENEK